ncbi:uncharacterized protein LOC119192266 [Manduca sexta]|uniref:uncharacterized protein LOC119192266 n=1 Tax=Manduca sexta TaxID=7130 RepID=UPI00188E04FA|nr:uncharacterized protein LOC119192266 [Manduca sexta]
MSRIAQKLCDEIVEPALNPSRTNTSAVNSNKYFYNSAKQEPKTTRSVVIEKRKVINKLLPYESGTRRNVKTIHSKDTVLRKKYVDVGSNTYITGPLRCDNNCVTLVRRRETRCSCKIPQKRTTKANVKQIQTLGWKNYAFTDKACARCIETVNCGTQFYDAYCNETRVPKTSRNTVPTVRDIKPWSIMQESPNVRRELSNTINRPTNLSHYYMGGKRWALSQYPTRGPDF